jgi:glycosyltransferase involved in cell wall biosynthesis
VRLRAYAGSLIWRSHDIVRTALWTYAHTLRNWRVTRPDALHRVLHVTGSFDLGGTQTQIKHLCTFGHTRYIHHATEIFPELNFLYRRGIRLDSARYGADNPITRQLGRIVLDRNHRSSQLVQIYKLVRDFQAMRPGVVVGWGHEMCVTTFAAAAIARVPHVVFCIRTFNPAYGWADEQFGRLLQQAHRRMLPHVSQVIANSTLLQRDYAEWAGIAPERVAVCPNGIDASALLRGRAAARARVRTQYGIAEDAVVIVNVGRFSKEKGQDSLLEANRVLQTRSQGARIVWLLCGDGASLPDVKAKAAEYGMTNVVFTGRTDAVAGMLSASDIFVMPSDFEGMPNAMMEAMAAGLPCVSTTRSGAVDVARDGVEALYYEPGNANQLADRLECLIAHPAVARTLGEAAAARIKEFDVATFVKNFESILDRTVVGRT